MTNDATTANTSRASESYRNTLASIAHRVIDAVAVPGARRVVLALIAISLVAASPAVAADDGTASTDSICDSTALTNFFSGLFKATTLVGISGALVIYKWQTLMEMVTFNQQQRKAIKQKKSDVTRGVAVLVLIGPAYTAIGSLMGLPGASCVFAL